MNPRRNEIMVERLLRGEPAKIIAADLGVDPSLPPLKAQRWGLLNQRLHSVRPEDITPKGVEWLASRAA